MFQIAGGIILAILFFVYVPRILTNRRFWSIVGSVIFGIGIVVFGNYFPVLASILFLLFAVTLIYNNRQYAFWNLWKNRIRYAKVVKKPLYKRFLEID